MPAYLVVYEDTAPFFSYSGAWRPGSSKDDPAAERYSESSFSVTQSKDASFSFSFYGTDVGIYGAKRGNHGLYQGYLDGTSSAAASGAASPDQFSVALYSATGGLGFHNVTLVNLEDKFLDIDWVSWKGSVGRDGEALIVNTWQDSHPAFVYTPSSSWTNAPPSVGTFSSGTGHGTSTQGAYVQVTFQVSDAIAVYGPSGPNSTSSYSVRVDNQQKGTYSALKQFYRARQLLYYGANLGPGTHTVNLTLEGSQMLAIDYAEIYTAPSLGGSFEGVLSTTGSPTGLIVGLIICALLAVLSLGLLIVMFALHKKGRFSFVPPRPGADEPMVQPYQDTQATFHHHYQPSQSTTAPSTYPSQVPPLTYAASSLSEFYQSTARDAMSAVSTGGSSSTNAPSNGAYRTASIRKGRAPSQEQVGAPVVLSPPAYS